MALCLWGLAIGDGVVFLDFFSMTFKNMWMIKFFTSTPNVIRYTMDTNHVKDILKGLDVLYMTRIQKERMDLIPENSVSSKLS